MSTATTMHVIVGTAGHIDHGKTSLIRRLTGVDTDRLPEEKKRGITIVLGFAPLDLTNGQRVGVVDVPGHERFVKNMVAGAGGIDVALMVIAADEGVMPQTREHLEICQLLGVRRGLIALTKIDRAEPELLELAIEDVKSEVEGTFLEGAPIIPCSSQTGDGIEALREALTKEVENLPDSPRHERSVLLPIDRCFSVKGFGTIITGTLIQGTLSVGDTVEILPPIRGHELDKGARVRGIQVFKESVEKAYGGQRTAVNLQGVDLESLSIGQIITTPRTSVPTKKISVQLSYLASRSKKLKSGAQILLHTGTALVEAGVTLFEKDALEPGESSFATLRLKEPIATLPGQRFIARGFDAVSVAGRTIAGGVVLDPLPGRRRRKSEPTVDVLNRVHTLILEGPDQGRLEDALVALVREKGPAGLGIDKLSQRLGYPQARCKKVGSAAQSKKKVALVGERFVDHDALDALAAEIEKIVSSYHREFPFRRGMPVAELVTKVGTSYPKAVVEHAAQMLVQAKRLERDSDGLRHPKHQPAAEADGASKDKLLEILKNAGFEPPTATELEDLINVRGKSFRELVAALVRSGELINAGSGIYFEKSAFAEAKRLVLELIGKEGGITTAQAKEMLKISRKFLIPLLEAMDKNNVTVRVGEVRKARPGASG